MQTLKEFYLTAKPPGLWKPVRCALSATEAAAARPNLTKDLVAAGLGVVFYFSLTVALFSQMGGHYKQMAFALAAAAISGIFFGKKAMARLQLTIGANVHANK
jgi:hypothetical protein